jgi:bifunctional UDP-N-acetylglucosamine pyrophosphorylase/glucosamine-1-phosphate N-acetyltransferase
MIALFCKDNPQNKNIKFRGEYLGFWIEKFQSLHLKEESIEILTKSKDIISIETAIKKLQIELFAMKNIFIEDFNNFYIEGSVKLGKDTVIGSGTVIKGSTSIGKNVIIYPNVFIENSVIGDNTVILPGSIIRDSNLEGNNKIGPYAHLRMNTLVKKNANIGNFVEMKKSIFREGSKAMHLSYIGDSDIGQKVNIGAGTITCNYDGINKNKTIIEDNVFIGSGTELIAPVKIGENAYVAAGSTITSDVPQDSLGVAREKQRNINGWVTRKKKIEKKEKM